MQTGTKIAVKLVLRLNSQGWATLTNLDLQGKVMLKA